MNPYEQRLRDEVIYLHSLWHQGPPRDPNPNLNPNPNFLPSSPRNLHFSNSATNQYSSRNLHVSNPASFKRKTSIKKKSKAKNVDKNHPPKDPGPEWPVNPPPSQATPGWPEKNPKSTQIVVQPASSEEQTKFAAVQMQLKVVEACREYFAAKVGSDCDEDNDSEEFVEGDEDYLLEKDGIEDSQEFKFFLEVFVENHELRSYYDRNHESGDFSCLVCGGIGEKVGKKFKSCLGLLQHAKAISNTKNTRAHRAFGHVICKVLGWDVDRLPTIVLKGEPLSRTLVNSSQAQGNGGVDKYKLNNNKDNVGSLSGEKGESASEDDIVAHQNNDESVVPKGSLEKDDAAADVKKQDGGVSNDVNNIGNGVLNAEAYKEGEADCVVR